MSTRLCWTAIVVAVWGSTWSCTASLPPSAALPVDEDQVAIQLAVLAWRDAGLPWSPVCNEQYGQIRIVVSQPREFTELCGRKPLHAGGRLYACNTEQYEQAFPLSVVDNDRVPLLVISELQPEAHRRLLVVHETLHWLERCSGKGIDFEHADRRVWEGARGGAQRAVIMALQDRGALADRVLWTQRSPGRTAGRTAALHR